VPSPGVQLHEEAVHEIVTCAYESNVLRGVGELALTSPEVRPRGLYLTYCGAVAEVDDDQPSQ
jgi:hypothetical protein